MDNATYFEKLVGSVTRVVRHSYYPGKEEAIELCLEEVEDLRIAVSELCAMISGDTDAPLALSFELSDDAVRVEGSSPARDAAPPPDDLELAQGLVAAVVDEHEVTRDDGVARFWLVKRRQR